MQYNLSKWRFGLNFSMPSLLLFEKGKRYREAGTNQLFNESESQFLADLALVGSDQSISSNYKDPFSIAFGVNYCPAPDKDMIEMSIEYFRKIPVYRLVNAEDSKNVILQSNISGDEFLSVWYGANNIVNVSVGYRKYINDGLTLLGGVRTDFDYLKGVDFLEPGNEYNNALKFNSDVLHITGGARFNILRHRFVVGAQYSFGKETDLKQLEDFVPQVDFGDVDLSFENLGESNVEFRYNSIAVFFGFIFDVMDKKNDPTIAF